MKVHVDMKFGATMVAPVVQVDGLYWPADDQDARPVITRDCAPSIAAILPHIRGRDLIVQAGANVGTYPLALADLFQRVVTCEPDPVNYECLRRNLEARDSLKRVMAFNAAFGAEQGACTPLEVHPRNCGAHRVSFGMGDIPVMTIDRLALTACDCIWADVEGSELFLLQGAEQTVERFSPVIAVEDKGLHRAFDIPDGALQAWLAQRGYVEIDQIGRDKVYRRVA